MGKRGKTKMKAITYEELKAGAALLSKRQLNNQRKKLRREMLKENADFRNDSLVPIDWASVSLSSIKKDIYEEYVKPSNLSPQEAAKYRKERGIIVKGATPNPITSLEEVSIPDFCMKKILANNKELTPIQAQTWPIALKGHDVVCAPNDDKGKTLAWLLPAILHIHSQPPPTPREGSIVLILSPNNQSVELIKAAVKEYTSGASMRCMCVLTGVPKDDQILDIARGHHIIIGTPSRIANFLIDDHINFKRCTFVVLNDADRMLNSELQVKQVLGQIRPDRQILMLVSTPQPIIPFFVNEFIGDHIEISIQTGKLSENTAIKQHVDVGMENDKGPKLKEILLKIYADQEPLRRGKIMVFVATKRRADKVRKFIASFLENCSVIHSDRSKQERALMLKDFQIGKSNILITTDSCDPDIIVDKVKYVINFDHPLDPNNYLRRLRRIDPGMSGHAYTFFTRKDAMFGEQLINDLRKTGQFVSKGLFHMARLGSDPTKNSIPIYYPRMKSGLTVQKNNLPQASSGKLFGGSSGSFGHDVRESGTESDGEDMDPDEGAGDEGFESRKNNNGSDTIGIRGSSDIEGVGLRGSGLHAGGGAGFGNDSGGFRETSGASGCSASGSGSFGGRDNNAGSGSRFGSQIGLHVGGGTGFGNMADDTGFSNSGGGSGFGSEPDHDGISTGPLAGNGSARFGNVTGFGENDSGRFQNITCDGIGNGRGFGIDNGENVRELCRRGDESRFGNIRGDRNFGGGTGCQNRNGDAISGRITFNKERDGCNRNNDESFSRNFGGNDRPREIGHGNFNRERNDNFFSRPNDSNSGGRGDDSYSQGNGGGGGFTGSGGYSRGGGFGGNGGFAGSGGFSGNGGFDRGGDFGGNVGFSGNSGFSGNGGFAGSGGFSANGGFAGSSGFSGNSGFAKDGDFGGNGGFSGNGDFGGNGGFSGNGGFAGSGGFSRNADVGGNGGFAGNGGDRMRGYGNSEGLDNRDNGNFRDVRSDNSFRNKGEGNFNRRDNFAFNNRSDNSNSNEQDTLFTRRDNHFNNRSGRGSYSGGHESNRNRPYNPQGGGGRGRNSAYGR